MEMLSYLALSLTHNVTGSGSANIQILLLSCLFNSFSPNMAKVLRVVVLLSALDSVLKCCNLSLQVEFSELNSNEFLSIDLHF